MGRTVTVCASVNHMWLALVRAQMFLVIDPKTITYFQYDISKHLHAPPPPCLFFYIPPTSSLSVSVPQVSCVESQAA